MVIKIASTGCRGYFFMFIIFDYIYLSPFICICRSPLLVNIKTHVCLWVIMVDDLSF